MKQLRMLVSLSLVATVGFTACGGNRAKQPVAVQTCAGAGANTGNMFRVEFKQDLASKEAIDQAAKELDAAISESCTQGKWAQAAIDCFATANSESMSKCDALLTEPQRDTLTQRAKAAVDSVMPKEQKIPNSDEESMPAPAAAPPPPPPPPNRSRQAAPKPTGDKQDPDDGGE